MSRENLPATNDIREGLVKMTPQFQMVLPKNVDPEKFTRVVLTAVMTTPKLMECNRQSIYAAALKCATDGLIPDGREAALVPFGGEARYFPMIGGIAKKVHQSGLVRSFDAKIVCENDEYDAWTDETGDHFRFKMCRGDRGKRVLTFAFAIMKDGGLYFEEVDEANMEKIRSMSKAGDSPWKGPFADEMRRKSALRRLFKYRVPTTPEVRAVFETDDEIEHTQIADSSEEPQKRLSAMERIKAQSEPEPAREPGDETE